MKMHIIKLGYYYFATDSINAGTQLIAMLSKMTPCKYKPDTAGIGYEPSDEKIEIGLEMNRPFHDPEAKQKPKKILALPKPPRGSILCICEKSYVAPRTICPHCSRPFSESHNRTHGDKPTGSNLKLS